MNHFSSTTTIYTYANANANISEADNLANLDSYLENEKIFNSGEPWSKLDKTAKLRKLIAFAEKYKEEHQLSNESHNSMILFFRECLDKRKLQRVKDVVYCKETGFIKEIPALLFNRTNHHFTLKNIDKRTSTIKGLAPKKKQQGSAKQGTAKNVKESDDDEDVNDNDNDDEQN
jgi:hypothetical protein